MKAGEDVVDRAEGTWAVSSAPGRLRRIIQRESILVRTGVAAATSERGQVAELRARQNPHSVFTTAAGVLFSITIIIDILLDRPGIDAGLLWLMLAFCLTFSCVAFLLGREFPVAVGMVCVGAFTAATVYFSGPWGDPQSAISSSQEMPILALYLGWFVPRPAGRILMLIIAALLALSFALNTDFHPDGMFGVPTAVQTIVISLFCFEIGSMLWRHSERRITIDPLTGVLNRAGFMAQLERRLTRFERSGQTFSLVVVDFDGLKELNDTLGHTAGDEALLETAKSWKTALRSSDLIGRTGGDEFAFLFGRTDPYEAQRIVRRLRNESPHGWSWGIAQPQPGDTVQSVLARADEILYAFKRARR